MKIIAAFAMLCSHIYKCLLFSHKEFLVLDIIGRISFPIFCFILVEGFCHTGSKRAYLIRLWIFAVFSELPFNLAFFGKLYAPEGQNVLFTMLIGFLVLTCMEKCEKIGKLLPLALGMAAACLLRVDYGLWGIWFIVCFYFLRGMKQEWRLLQTANCMISMLLYGWIQIFAILALPVIMKYNGQPGKSGRIPKYFFYFFYPLHLLLLILISNIIQSIQL